MAMNLHKNNCAVRTEVINDVLLIEINNPPVNADSPVVNEANCPSSKHSHELALRQGVPSFSVQ